LIRAILTDIEGTTTSISFVKDTLFPYARAHMADFLRQHGTEPHVVEILEAARVATGLRVPAMNDEELQAQLLRWLDDDRKIQPLKTIQGLIWEDGYQRGAFNGHIYEDAARRLREWHEAGLLLYVFSSGSVLAQKLLFAHTRSGDLSRLFSGYFDTTVGAKGDVASYRRIAAEIGIDAGAILFLSDVASELDAAVASGMQALWLVREGYVDPAARHLQVRDFDAVDSFLRKRGAGAEA
jgi:enolase-phosphatase E1